MREVSRAEQKDNFYKLIALGIWTSYYDRSTGEEVQVITPRIDYPIGRLPEYRMDDPELREVYDQASKDGEAVNILSRELHMKAADRFGFRGLYAK